MKTSGASRWQLERRKVERWVMALLGLVVLAGAALWFDGTGNEEKRLLPVVEVLQLPGKNVGSDEDELGTPINATPIVELEGRRLSLLQDADDPPRLGEIVEVRIRRGKLTHQLYIVGYSRLAERTN